MNNDLTTLRAQLDAFEKSEHARDPNADVWGSPKGQRLLAEYRKENRKELDKLTVAERLGLMMKSLTTLPRELLAGKFDIETIEQAFFNHDHNGSEPAPGQWEKRRDQWHSFKAYLAKHPRQKISGRDAYKDGN